MSGFGYGRQVTVFDGASGTSSTVTSASYLVADAAQIAASWISNTTAASKLTVRGSNDDGLKSAIVNWSVISAVGGSGPFTITPGVRWVSFLKPSADSNSTVMMEYWVR